MNPTFPNVTISTLISLRPIIHLLSVVLLVLSAALSLANADETSERATNVVIEEATIAPSNMGSAAPLKFRISNLGRNRLTLKGAQAKVAERVRLSMNLSGNGFEEVTELYLLPDETLDLRSSHIKVELVGLKRDLKAGEQIEFILDFGDFKTSAVADVH